MHSPSITHPLTYSTLLQVASKEFFAKMVPLFDGGDDVGMVLSPQARRGMCVCV